MSQYTMSAMSLSPDDAAALSVGAAPVTDRVPDREEWVEAACKLLAYGCELEQLTSQSLAEIVGVSESRLLRDYPEKNDFLTAVLRRLLDEVGKAGAAAIQDEEPSLFRLCRGIWATLNAHQRRPAIPLLWRTLHGYGAAQALEQQRTAAQLAALQAEFEAVGVPQAAGYARIVNAMTMDIAEAEHIAGQALPEQRRSICSYLRSLQPETS